MYSPGKTAFEAYNEDRGGVNFQGDPTPPWESLPEKIRHAWEVAAKAVMAVKADDGGPGLNLPE